MNGINELIAGARDLIVATIIGILGGVWWMVRKLLAHDATFALLKQDMDQHREVTDEIRSDVKRLLERGFRE